jgi:chromosome segregation protein
MRWSQEIEGIRAQQASATAAFSEVEARVEEALVEKSRAHNEVTASQQAITDLTREFRDAQRKAAGDRSRARAAHGPVQVAAATAGTPRRIWRRRQGRAAGQARRSAGGGVATPITHGLEIKPEYAKALEAILGSAVEAISVLDVATAQRILAQLEGEQIGAAVLRVGDVGAGRRTEPGPALPPGLITAASVVGFSTDDHPVLALLDACYIAEDLNAFLEFWKTNPGFSFLTVAHRSGNLVDQRGLVSGGYHKKSANSHHAARGRSAGDRQGAGGGPAAPRSTRGRLIDGLQARLTKVRRAWNRPAGHLAGDTQSVAAVQQEQRGARRHWMKIGAIDSRASRTRSWRWSRRDMRRTYVLNGPARSDRCQRLRGAQRERISRAWRRIVELRTDRDVKRESLAQARLELAERRQRVEVLDRGLADMERRRSQLSELLVQRQQEIEVWSEQVSELEQVGDRQKRAGAQAGGDAGRGPAAGGTDPARTGGDRAVDRWRGVRAVRDPQ